MIRPPELLVPDHPPLSAAEDGGKKLRDTDLRTRGIPVGEDNMLGIKAIILKQQIG